jgi:hypothetical protein
MFKFLAFALILQTCRCQLILSSGLTGLGGLTSLSGYGGLGGYGGLNGQLIALAPQSLATTSVAPQSVILLQAVPQSLAVAPVATTYARPTIAIRAPAPVITAPAPAPVVIQAPRPAPVIVQAAPRPVVTVAEENYGPAEPYNYGYQTQDEEGNAVSRQETSDGSGTVRGSYSYTDTQGLNRIVEYIADAGGFRASVQTNEPGTANANPADVQITAQEPPAAVVAAYINPPSKRVSRK